MPGGMDSGDLRIALFSGNYNYVRDGANRALNQLVAYLLRHGVKVRVYSPTVENPPFEPVGDLVSLPSVPVPGRGEYHFPYRLSGAVKRDLERFSPDIVHISSPDLASRQAVKWAKGRGLPAVASVHTAFETYLGYYRLGFMKSWLLGQLRKVYRQCDTLLAPSESFAEVLRQQAMNDEIALWTRGVDHEIFNPGRRDPEWRRGHGIADKDVVIGFLGRFVLEKGLDVFVDVIEELQRRGVPHRVMAIGEGPAKSLLDERLPDTVFTGFLSGAELARAVANLDVFLNPSVTETFGNVTLEAMACGVPVVAARAPGSASLVDEGVTGRLVGPRAVNAYADAIAAYVEQPDLRAAHGQAGAARARGHSWDDVNRVVLDRYLALIGAPKSLEPA